MVKVAIFSLSSCTMNTPALSQRPLPVLLMPCPSPPLEASPASLLPDAVSTAGCSPEHTAFLCNKNIQVESIVFLHFLGARRMCYLVLILIILINFRGIVTYRISGKFYHRLEGCKKIGNKIIPTGESQRISHEL